MATYQTFVSMGSTTQAAFQSWGQSFGQALSSFGWVKQSVSGSQTDNGLTGASYQWTGSPVAGTAAGSFVNGYPQGYTFKGAWVSGNTYVGSNAINFAGEVDLVTNGGLTYVHITSTSALATAPGSDTTNWQPYVFEVWKSNGSMSSTFPIYLKLVYAWSTGNLSPAMLFQIGTGVDSNGNLTGTANWGDTAPTHTLSWYSASFITPTTSAFECDFQGDADNFNVCMFKNNSSGITGLFINRAVASSGTYSDAFVHIAFMGYMRNSNPQIMRSACWLKPALGGGLVAFTASWNAVLETGTTNNVALGTIPGLPIFPMPGYVANPLLGIMAFGRGDVGDGQTVPVWLYGASHPYMVLGFAAASMSPDGVSSRQFPAMRWE